MIALKHITFNGQNIEPGEFVDTKGLSQSDEASMIKRGLIQGEIIDISIDDVEISDPTNNVLKGDIEPAISIDKLRTQFEAKFGKPVSNNKKNDSEWILNKLNS